MESTNSIYRGGCEELQKINYTGMDLSRLTKESTPREEGEPVRKFFPVRSQLSWFRLQNGNKGSVLTEIVSMSETQAVLKARVLIEGVEISCAHATANIQIDSQDASNYRLIEFAESKAISRALDFAGYGCQLDLDTLSQDADSQIISPAPIASSESNPAIGQPNGAEQEVCTPESPKGKMRVDANAPSNVVDISEIDMNDEKPQRTRRTRKADKVNKAAEEQPDTSTSKEQLSFGDSTQNASEALFTVNGKHYLHVAKRAESGPDNYEWDYTLYEMQSHEVVDGGILSVDASDVKCSDVAKNICEMLNIDSPAIAKAPLSLVDILRETSQQPVKTEQQDSHPATDTGSFTENAAQKVWNWISEAQKSLTDTPVLDETYFGSANQDPEAMFINADKPTKMRNSDLYWAIKYLSENPEEALDQIYPTKTGPLTGKTYREVFEILGEEKSKQALKSCKVFYLGSNVPSYAAALVLNHTM